MTTIETIMQKFETAHLAILGLGREGISTYEFFRRQFPDKKIFLIDEKAIGLLGQQWQSIESSDPHAIFSTHFDHQEFLNKNNPMELIVFKTPGIAPTHPLVKQAQYLQAQLYSNTNLLFELLETFPKDSTKTIAVTGTKGKSTTTALIHHVLQTNSLHAVLGGNIGVAPLSLYEQVSELVKNNLTNMPVFVVLELSCHQLNDFAYSPDYAIVLDISPEHLDYYASFNEYIQAKSHLTDKQTEEQKVIFDESLYFPKKLAHLGDAQHLTFSESKNIRDNWIMYDNQQIAAIDTLPFVGKHTLMNALPAVVISKQLHIENSDIARALQTFATLPHRLELIGKIEGVTYYNDSLSTTPKATIKAIESFSKSPIILIAGGYDRNLDYSELAEVILNHNVKHLIVFPDTGEILLEEIRKRLSTTTPEILSTHVSSMQQAVSAAKQTANSGDVVLLSPASASFNLFKDYHDRGEQFRKYVTLDTPDSA